MAGKQKIGVIYYDANREEAVIEFTKDFKESDFVFASDCLVDIRYLSDLAYKNFLKNRVVGDFSNE